MASLPTRRSLLRSIAVLAVIGALLPIGASPAFAHHGGGFHAVQLDGANDHVAAGQDLFPSDNTRTGPTSFTIETWFKKTGGGISGTTGSGGLTNVVPLVTKGGAQAETPANVNMNYFLGINTSTNTLAADFEDTTGGTNQPMNVTTATPDDPNPTAVNGAPTLIQNGVWYHAAATYDATSGVWRLYLNGVLEATRTIATATERTPEFTSIQHAALGTTLSSTGGATSAPQPFFAGEIDEARVWSVVRTQAEIRDTLDQEIASQAGLIARWSLNEGTGTAADNSGSITEAALAGGATWSAGLPYAPTLPGPGNRALSLGGAESYVDLGSPPALGLSSFTLETWVRRAASGGAPTDTGAGGVSAQPLIAKGRAEGENSNIDMNYFLGINASGAPVADFEDASGGTNHPVTGTVTVPAGEWHHVAATYDNASGEWRLYVDGAPAGNATIAAGGGRNPRADSIHRIGIGTAMNSTAKRVGFFAGTIDEVRIWDHARTAAQVGASFDDQITSAAGLVGSWSMDEGDGITVGDAAGDDNSGVLYNGTWVDGFTVTPVVDRALDLDGDDFLTATNDLYPADATRTGPTSFTVETWFRRQGAGSGHETGIGGIASAIPLVTKGAAEAESPANLNMNYYLGIDAATGVLVADFEDTATGANHPISGTTQILSNDTWHHAAATYNAATSTWSLYLDGALQNSETESGATPQFTSIQPAAIGTSIRSNGTTTQGFFNGVIDEVRVWEVARTQAEIQGAMHGQLTSSPSGLISRWALNEASGTSAGNSVAGRPVATINGNPTRVDGFTVSVVPPGPGNCGLRFNGSSDYVTFGDPAALDLSQFTVETWFRRTGDGTATTTGTGGVPDALPLVSKGAQQADNSNVDSNYVLGLDQSSGVLIADFEEGAGGASPGLNHPISGETPVTDSAWHHAAATYDGTTWRLYLDGELDGTLAVNRPVRSDSIQHAGLGSSLNSTGARNGFFQGDLDEARIWNSARTLAQINAAMNADLTVPSAGLVARWGMGECTGTTLASTPAGISGTLNGPAWITPGFVPPVPNDPPAISNQTPADNATNVENPPTLSVNVDDPEDDPVDVTFYGRPAVGTPTQPFTLVTIPDTQHYVDSSAREFHFGEQTEWIVANKDSLNVKFVSHLGDIVENRDVNRQEWLYATAHMAVLDAAQVPNNLAPGNHDASSAGVAAHYDEFFPPSRYEGDRAYYDNSEWYGGYQGDPTDGISDGQNRLNKDNYELFSAGGMDFIIIHLEYDMPDYAVQWADRVLEAHPNRHAILSTHLFLNTSNQRPSTVLNRPDGTSAAQVWNTLVTDNCNVFLIVNGHYPGEGRRVDPHPGAGCGGHPVHQVVMDYQSRANGGDGWLRYFVFEPDEDEIEAFTFSPTRNGGQGEFETDASSRFTLDWDMPGNAFQQIGSVQQVPSGTGTAQVEWLGLDPEAGYEWYAVASDGLESTTSPTNSFTTEAPATNEAPVATDDTYSTLEDTELSVTAADGVLDNDTDPDGDPLTAAVLDMPDHGALALGPDGSFLYTPTAHYDGSDSFTYRASDGTLHDEATVAITVTGVSDAPQGTNATISTAEDTPRALAQADFGFSDPHDAPPDAFTGVLVQPASDGTLSVSGTPVTAPTFVGAVAITAGDLVFTPTSGESGVAYATFDFQVRDVGSTDDGGVITDPTLNRITIDVTADNDPPVAQAQSVTTAEDTAKEITLVGSDPEGADLTYAIADQPAHGVLSGSGANRTYTPAADYQGPDAFTFRVNDGTQDSTAATVSITVTPANDAPTISQVADQTIAEDGSTGALGFTVGDAETAAGSLTVTATSSNTGLVPNANVVLGGTGASRTVTVTPVPNGSGTTTITLQVSDGTASGTETFDVIVTPVNDTPVAQSQTLTTPQNTPITVTLVATDVDENLLTYRIESLPAGGTLYQGTGTGGTPITSAPFTLAGNTVTFSPNGGFAGSTNFTFRADDGTVNSNTATISISVAAQSPVITSVAPAKGVRPGATMTINGLRLGTTTNVTFAGLSGPVSTTNFTIDGDTRLRVAVPLGSGPTTTNGPITGAITVTTQFGSATSSGTFKILPRVDSINPRVGPIGTTVTINGLAVGDSSTPTVRFGGVAAVTVTVIDWDTITAVVPTGARSGKIEVITRGGSAKSTQTYSVR